MKRLSIFTASLLCATTLLSCSDGGSSSTSTVSLNSAHENQQSKKAVASDYQTVVEALYLAYFGRPADPAGLANLESALLSINAPTTIAGLQAAYASNVNLQSLVNNFGTSAESVTLYGSINAPASTKLSFVGAVFQNALGRAPLAAGLTYWSEALANGDLTQGGAALAILAAAMANTSTQGISDTQLINNRLTVSNYFTTQISAQNASAAYAGTNAAILGRATLGAVTATTNPTTYETTVNTLIGELINPNGQALGWSGNAVAWSGSQYVAVGQYAAVETSPDGITWTTQTSPLNSTLTGTTLNSVAWLGNQFVATGVTGGGAICQAQEACPMFIMADYSFILTSPDGIHWTSRFATSETENGVSVLFSSPINAIAWSGSEYVAVGQNTILTSPDAVTWTEQVSSTSPSVLSLTNITWTGSQFVAVGPGTILTSVDGITWIQRTPGSTNALNGVASSATTIVAAGANGTILSSSTGATWATQTSGTTAALNGISWSGTQFVAVGANGTILTSSNGLNWTAQNSGTTQALSGITWSGTQFVAVGASVILTSPDGITWTSRTVP